MNQLNKKMGKKKFVLFAVVIVLGIAVSITMNWNVILAATYNWTQSIPSLGLGGLGWVTETSTNASHLANQANWQYYSSKDTAIATSSNGIGLTLTPTSWTTTSENDFKTTGYSASSTLSINSKSATTTAAGNVSLCPNKVQDANNNIYDTVVINNQCWMAKNLNVGTTILAPGTLPTNNGVIEKWCNGADGGPHTTTGDCVTYGGLYHWDEAMAYSTTEGAQGICPAGWHIPTDSEQDALERYYWTAGGSSGSCNASRSALWECDPAGTQLKSTVAGMFSGLLAGNRNTDGSFYYRGTIAYFWSSTQSSTTAWNRSLNSAYATVYRVAYAKALGFSVRCLKD